MPLRRFIEGKEEKGKEATLFQENQVSKILRAGPTIAHVMETKKW